MIVDAHCHVWGRWPYDPPVPDPDSRARVEQLLWHMDQNGVDHAVVIAAAIGDNPRNASDAFAAAAAHPGKLTVFPDLECRWSADYQTPGAAARLQAAWDRWGMKGITTYLGEEEDGSWLLDPEGEAFFALAERLGLIASLSLMPHQLPACAELARRHPGLPVLLHHHGFFGPRSGTTAADRNLAQAVAAQPNVYVKLSGLGNVAGPAEDYPYHGLDWLKRMMADLFPGRMVWGSDFPVSTRHMTYRQTLEVLRRHGSLPEAELRRTLGPVMAGLLALT